MGSEIDWTKFIDEHKIDLSNKALGQLPHGVSVCENIDYLNLEFNSLENVPEDFGDLRCLKILNCNHNLLSYIPKCIFNLIRLEELSVNNNRLERVDKDIGNLCDLMHLDLSNNKLVKLTPGVGFLNRLKHVNLSNNLLQSIPHELTAICGLAELDVSCNKIKDFPCVRNLLHLRVIRAKSNLMKKLPDLSQCRELVYIDFGHNLIEEIDSASLNCQPFLKEIYLQCNKIREIPNDLTNLASLCTLDISSNKLMTLPSNIIDFPNIQTLRIANNPFKDIPAHYTKTDTGRLLTFLREKPLLSPNTQENEEQSVDEPASPSPTKHATLSPARHSLSHLRKSCSLVHNSSDEIPDSSWDNSVTAHVLVVNFTHSKLPLPLRITELKEWLLELHLVDTGLSELPLCVCQLKELQVLSLDRNVLTDLPVELAKCKYMKQITLAYNRFTEVPAVVFQLTKVHVLDLSNNQLRQIEQITPNLATLPFLHTLDLSNNELSSLPPELGLVTQLKSLTVTGNRFRQPSYHVLSKGTQAVLDYLRNKLPEEDKEKDNNPPVPISYFIHN